MIDRFPTLANLYGAYFHEDFDLDYASPDDVILSFTRHLDLLRIQEVLAELSELSILPSDEQIRIIKSLGCRYSFLDEWKDSSAWIFTP